MNPKTHINLENWENYEKLLTLNKQELAYRYLKKMDNMRIRITVFYFVIGILIITLLATW